MCRKKHTCVFFPTHIFLQLPEEAICGDKALKAHALLGVCAARPGGLCALGCTWFRPPAGTVFWLSGFLFHRCHTKRTASPCTVCCPVRNSVQVRSRTACSSELPHLLPPCGARCALVPTNLVLAWLGTSPLVHTCADLVGYENPLMHTCADLVGHESRHHFGITLGLIYRRWAIAYSRVLDAYSSRR